MIDFYYWPTPNGWKVAIMLEECGLDYRLVPVNIGKGEQFMPEFLALSPNNRMPAPVPARRRLSSPGSCRKAASIVNRSGGRPSGVTARPARMPTLPLLPRPATVQPAQWQR